ncbi:MAG: hypothetical protein JKY54_10565, partial [Flavobacteriales bacterium]|nr:hypothetical protein [Flavobacteriales bacterium]
KELEELEAKSKADYDYLQFQFDELKEVKLEGIDLPGLESELELLNNAEELNALAIEMNDGMSGDQAILAQLNSVKFVAEKLASISNQFQPLSDRLTSSIIELQDIAVDFDSKSGDLEHDPDRIKELTSTVNELNKLLFKHHYSSLDELVLFKEGLDTKLNQADSLDEDIQKAKGIVEGQLVEVMKVGEKLSELRNDSVVKLAAELKVIVGKLSMEDALFNFRLTRADQPSPLGIDRIETEVCLNKGSSYLSIEKAASGGELGRIMLALKVIISEGSSIPTIIFDEIDTGVSGNVANKMADLLAKISDGLQLICISHLPQIASKGKQHYKVFKATEGERTNTRIVLLNKDERLLEIAEMLSGKDPSNAAVQNARELLN